MRARSDRRDRLASGKIGGMETPAVVSPPATATGTGRPPATPRWAAGLAGVVAAGLALGLSEWLSGIAGGVPSLVGSVGQAAIDWSPGGLVHLGIRLLGHHDKTFVIATILVVCAVAAAALGIAGSRRRWVARAGFTCFGVVGVVAAGRAPGAQIVEIVVAVAVCVVAGLALLELLYWLAARPAVAEPVPPDRAGRWQPGWTPSSRHPTRRAFLATATAAGAVALAAAAGGRRLVRQAANAARSKVTLPPVADSVAPPTAANSVGVPGVTPVVVANGDFYEIDTRLLGPPSVDVGSWRLQITGAVDHPFELTWDELAALPMIETYITLQCVSNEVGGNLVGNAAWRGVRLADLLNQAGVHPGADQIVGRSVDHFTVGFPTSAAFDGRHALVAVGMNGDLLPLVHGFPARLIVAGLYGYVSATKWLTEIELTRFGTYDSYWVQRGWDRLGTILTESRIDTIAPNPPVAGPCTLAGVAWAPTRGISKVEVQVDNTPWGVARLAAPLSNDTWRQWAFPWLATPGHHLIRVRATDGQGQTQSATAAEPYPGPATGYHTVAVSIRG
jgi:DMSO/TMAO reductase YedYZ molybdopterin-dependent catalytic subunit